MNFWMQLLFSPVASGMLIFCEKKKNNGHSCVASRTRMCFKRDRQQQRTRGNHSNRDIQFYRGETSPTKIEKTTDASQQNFTISKVFTNVTGYFMI
jgi:hypothetical protein